MERRYFQSRSSADMAQPATIKLRPALINAASTNRERERERVFMLPSVFKARPGMGMDSSAGRKGHVRAMTTLQQ
jgi:hypothetical protein